MKRSYRIIVSSILLFALPMVIHSKWEVANNGIRPNGSDTTYYIGQIVRLGNLLIALSIEDYIYGRYLYYSSDEGTSWHDFQRPDVPDTAKVSGIFATNDTLYAIFEIRRDSLLQTGDTTIKATIKVLDDQGVYRTTDYGKNWERVWKMNNKDSSISYIFACGENIMLAGRNAVYYSADGGKNWVKRHNGLVLDIPPKDLNGTCGFLCSSLYLSGVYCTDNWGEKWFKIVPEKTLGFPFNKILVKDNNVFAGVYYYGMVISTDKGVSWEHSQFGGRYEEKGSQTSYFRNTVDATVSAILKFDNILVAGVSSLNKSIIDNMGVYFSIDTGKSWKYLIDGLKSPKSYYTVYSLAETDNYIFVCINDIGVYRISKAELKKIASGVESKTEGNVYHFYITEGRPMPASGMATVRIYWDAQDFDPTTADVSIYDVYGKRIGSRDNVVITPMSPNSAKIDWKCENAATGVYFLVINYRGESRASKVVVLR